eukprot:391218-Lingulodinium_polyedra.AAC.1
MRRAKARRAASRHSMLSRATRVTVSEDSAKFEACVTSSAVGSGTLVARKLQAQSAPLRRSRSVH